MSSTFSFFPSFTQTRHQDAVSLTLGIWWLVTVLGGLLYAASMPFYDAKPFDSERFLQPHHASPAGYKVPCLPDFEIDPALARVGNVWMVSLATELVVAMVLAGIVGSGLLYLVYTNWDEQLASHVQSTLNSSDL